MLHNVDDHGRGIWGDGSGTPRCVCPAHCCCSLLLLCWHRILIQNGELSSWASFHPQHNINRWHFASTLLPTCFSLLMVWQKFSQRNRYCNFAECLTRTGQLVCLFVIVHSLCISSPPLAITGLVLAIFIAIPGGNQEIEIGSMQIEKALKNWFFTVCLTTDCSKCEWPLDSFM